MWPCPAVSNTELTPPRCVQSLPLTGGPWMRRNESSSAPHHQGGEEQRQSSGPPAVCGALHSGGDTDYGGRFFLAPKACPACSREDASQKRGGAGLDIRLVPVLSTWALGG